MNKHLLPILCYFFILQSAFAASEPVCPFPNNKDVAVSTLPKAPYVSVAEARQWQKADKPMVFIDVREPQEFDTGHIPGAINIPYAQAEERLKELDRDKAHIFYCIHSSWRAPYVANLAADMGDKNAYILDGGVAAWNAGGQEIVSADPSQKPAVAEYPKDLAKVLETPPQREYKVKIDLTLDQLAEFDGKNGRPAYVAVDGIIYDLTESRLWRAGEHDPSKGKGQAGCDLTELIKDSPHGKKHLVRFPIVGKLLSLSHKGKPKVRP